MADLENPTKQREFLCEHCAGKIAVPHDLPPTTGPCPYCDGTITSPALEMPEVPAPEPHFPAAPAVVKIKEKVAPTHPSSVTEITEKPKAQLPEPPQTAEPIITPAEPKVLDRPRTGLVFKALALLTLILLGGATAYFALKKPAQTINPPAVMAATLNEANYLHTGWQKDAHQLLRRYLAAKSTEEKLPLILNGSQLKATINDFYDGGTIHDADIPVDSFVVNELTEEDRKRGLFRMVFTQPPPATLRVYAFFKSTPDGLKLDWEIFAQTKYRTLQKFVDQPKVGKTGVFRVLMMGDLPDKARATEGKSTYQMVDPANPGDAARVRVKVESDAGKALALINWQVTEKTRPITRTATVELRWSGLTNAPELEISRLICWEFLGLGGQEFPATPATK